MKAKPNLTFNGFSMHPLDALKNTAVLFEAGYLLATSNNHEYSEIGDTIVTLATDYAFEVKNAIFYSRQDIAPEKQPEYMVNLRAQREACGLTTTELARLLDLDEEIILQWESGEYEPTISMLIPLANILGCDPMWLLTGESSNHQSPATPVHQSRNQYSGQQRSDASDHASHHVKHQSQA
ncbi:helix-turn-helix domain-containing protein [Salmonella enterica]|nr:helix-turn-helix domain-containing protein [Salmonella enterica]